MLALVVRSAVGMTVAPTIDLFRGEKVTARDYLPFSGVTRSDYDLEDFVKDLGYSTVGALVAATPYTTLVGTEILTGSTPIPFSVVPAGLVAAAVVPVAMQVHTIQTQPELAADVSFTGQFSGKYFDY